MAGEIDLSRLLRDLGPELDDVEYGFATLGPGAALPPGLRPLGIFEETEGTTIIAPAADLAAHGIDHSPGWARITLTIHSSLAAVGLTASVATALARAGISANVAAAWHHDHVFVPWNRRHEAMETLAALSADGTGSAKG